MSVNIETLMGSENFPGMQSKVWLFVPPTRAHPNPAGEVALFAAAKTGVHGIATIRQGARIAAAEGAGTDLGWFTQASYGLPEGMILKLFAMRKTGSQPLRACAIFLRTRADAALNRFAVDLTGYNRATVRQAWVEGRFEQIAKHEAIEAGVRISPMHDRQFNRQVSDMMIRKTEMSPMLRAATVVDRNLVTNSDGEAVVVQTHRRKRMLDV